jgi:hypothetical protein
MKSLYQTKQRKRPWIWGEAENTAFEGAKELLSSDLRLVSYELNKELLLICVSSSYGVGAIIVRVMDTGTERPVMMTYRTLQPHERQYGQIDKEALAIIFRLTKFHEFLAGRQFCIITDHKPLIGLFSQMKPFPDQISPRMLRWEIGNADALSRWKGGKTAIEREKPIKEILLLEERLEG